MDRFIELAIWVIVVLTLMLLVVGVTYADPPQGPPVNCGCAFGQCTCGCLGLPCECVDCQCDTYVSARARAVRDGKPFLVWVGCEPKNIPGVVHWKCKSFHGVTSGVVVAAPGGSDLVWVDTLPASSSGDDVRAALATRRPAQVVRPPAYFVAPVRRGGGC